MILWMAALFQLPESDREFIMGLYSRYREMVLRRVRSRVPVQEAEDVLGRVMERLVGRVEHLRSLTEEQRRRYVFSVTRSAIADFYRRKGVEERFTACVADEELENAVDGAPPMEEAAAYRQLVNRVKQLCARLPEEQQLLLELRYVQELGGEEIARQLGVSPDAVRKRLSRIHQKLREMLDEEGWR